ncbi:DNA methyltransferase [Streptomyces sp. NBC_01803]|uniref:DNA methyltransferase n=1 Tax=Streptomyces sp. NBC_01803 TaxID=2975946 RepID=UPI002DDC24BE|nr:DNA methyltransferase [Streptomyces sp. NBC_01803]WSA44236.1 site-specific DNA-methyltransferase [Streptomyces sp. NBC_01803]
MTTTVDRAALARNEHLTFRANMGVGRHGWLRLTPAYGVRLVRDRLSHLPEGSVITDPFSGTGTTPLAAAELGHFGQSVDVNPFLIWLGTVKTSHYSPETLLAAADATQEVVASARAHPEDNDLWQPSLFKIEKWWSPGALHALKALRASIDQHEGQVKDLLEISLCRSLISCSNAAFNHQSMSFKEGAGESVLFEMDEAEQTFAAFGTEMSSIIESARYDLLGSARVYEGDSREGVRDLKEADLVLTSPPYVNRMSYIRELRPYMYWLRHLDLSSDAGDLDWRAIGGTWGTATSKLNSWQPHTVTPVDDAMRAVCERIATDGGKNGPLLSTYVHKYHHDMWLHFQAITPTLKHGGSVSYIVGNSTFYKHEVPAQEWYAAMLRELGYQAVKVEIIRKRNSNKALFEYEVTGTRP